MSLEVVQMPLSALKEYEGNAKIHDEANVEAIRASIRRFGMCDPIGVWTNPQGDVEIVEGHGRKMALEAEGYEVADVIFLDHLTDEERRAYALAHNQTTLMSDFDLDILEAELDLLADFDMGDFGFDVAEEEILTPEDGSGGCCSLADRFIAPPFSVLDTRQGYWQERKKAWKSVGFDSTAGRDDNLITAGVLDKERFSNKSFDYMAPATSEFDPVLCEVSYLWFCPEGGSVLDPFCGGSVRGVVASMTGHAYTGIDIRQEQVDENRSQADKLGLDGVTWICDDAQNLLNHVEDKSADLVFSCPPYFDLEVYSDDERDISNMDYDGFIAAYRRIISSACRALKDDRFAVFVVGDVRNKKSGEYRNFVSDTIGAFKDAGLMYYNEIILVNVIGTAALRAQRQFSGMRKVCKTHQNVLVFYKGNPAKIKNNLEEIGESPYSLFGGDEE